MCKFWGLILRSFPARTHKIVLHRVGVIRDLVAKLLYAAPFGSEELKLLEVLQVCRVCMDEDLSHPHVFGAACALMHADLIAVCRPHELCAS